MSEQVTPEQLRQICRLQEIDESYEFMRQVALAISQRLNATRLQLLDVFGSEQGVESETDNRSRGTA
jgi:hypothetical protein